ncbi:hypothetical protein [Streptomyces chryseus]
MRSSRKNLGKGLIAAAILVAGGVINASPASAAEATYTNRTGDILYNEEKRTWTMRCPQWAKFATSASVTGMEAPSLEVTHHPDGAIITANVSNPTPKTERTKGIRIDLGISCSSLMPSGIKVTTIAYTNLPWQADIDVVTKCPTGKHIAESYAEYNHDKVEVRMDSLRLTETSLSVRYRSLTDDRPSVRQSLLCVSD